VLVLVLVCAWGVLGSSGVSITFNGEELEGPFALLVGGWGLVVSTVVLFCVAILLAFILAGVGLIVVGALALTGIILVGVAFPFLLPLLIPLAIVWAFCAGARRGARKNQGIHES
ncbi:MAG: hypothetical protein ABFR33_06590, partial [Verrucomicrobiota bacterium]